VVSIPAFAEQARTGPQAPGRGASAAREWRFPLRTAVAWALGLALAMSTQYLAQPFVWRYWTVEEVLLGWLDVLRDRILVAVPVALALAAVVRAPVTTLAGRAGLVGLAVPVGAVAGEALGLVLGSGGERIDAWSVLGRVMQWTALGLCAAVAYGAWSRNREAAAEARASALAISRHRSLLVETQLQALRQQLDPHFLFNTLATIRHLSGARMEEGADLLRHLNDYLASTSAQARDATTLGAEIDLVASYLAITRIRMTGRLAVEIAVPASLRAYACPPLTLATLVENAVKHGITPRAEGGTIRVEARREGAWLCLVVTDTGAGIAPATMERVGGAGIGLANLRARLRALHGDRAALVLRGNAPRGVQAEVRLPVTRCTG